MLCVLVGQARRRLSSTNWRAKCAVSALVETACLPAPLPFPLAGGPEEEGCARLRMKACNLRSRSMRASGG
eukprot:12897928-Prorocentrum_lima.AAC.1